ncbi:uncharacterized protein LOC117190486 [Drosophila miranda]|uniref:uncharacterized protein LOC117190486 n=1 Tax=Drosophila miranda TaxID=7229 RepID=UPI00143FABD6|nr:uncharacterized protein LOC117190486 [Drosophila miranda]
MHAKLNNFRRHLDVLYTDLHHRWVNMAKADRELIGLHDDMLSSMNSFNKCVIKCNMHIDLNSLETLVADIAEPLQRNDFVTNTNKDGIVVKNILNERPHRLPIIQQMADSKHIIPIDQSAAVVRDVESTQCPARPVSDSLSLSTRSSWLNKPDAKVRKQKAKPITSPQPTSAQPQDTATVSAKTKTMLPVSPRKRILEPPKCGRTTSSSKIYHQIVKNIAAFPEGSLIKAEMMHLNIAEKCFFVGMWGAEPLQKLFEGKLLLKELYQLPNFGFVE